MTGKSNKQSKSGKTTQQEVVAPVQPVAEQVVAPVVEQVVEQVVAPVVAKKGGRAKAQPAAEPAQPAAPAQPVAEPAAAPAQEGGKRKRKAEAPAPVEVVAAAPVEEAAPKKRRARAAPVQEAEQPEGEAEVEQGGRHLRSFKVRLPNKEEYEGRFTGLTPYQAANKALSKYFRETENPQAEVTFSICESTRKSKKSVYTYVGRRVQLEVPVRYTIDGGREIVKNFKNSLKKVKKQQAEPVQPVA